MIRQAIGGSNNPRRLIAVVVTVNVVNVPQFSPALPGRKAKQDSRLLDTRTTGREIEFGSR